MSMFLCAKCDNLKDSDDGCAEAPASMYGRPFQLLCVDCMPNDDSEPLNPDRPFSADQQALIDKWEAEASEGLGPDGLPQNMGEGECD